MSKWIRTLTAGDGIDLLADVDTTTVAPQLTNLLEWDGTNWVPAIKPTGGASQALASVRFATVGPGTLATSFVSGLEIDGTSPFLSTGDRILIKDQADPIENGVYTVNVSGAPTRASDLATGTDAVGVSVTVEEGERNVSTSWLCGAPASADTVGTHALTWRSTTSHSIAAGAWRAQISAGSTAAGAVRFSTDTKGGITSVDLSFTPVVGSGFGTLGQGEGMISVGTVLSFQNLRDPRDTVTLLVDTMVYGTDWSAGVTYLGQSGLASITGTDLYTCVIMGGSKVPIILYEDATLAVTDSAAQRIPDTFEARTGWFRVRFQGEVTAISGGTLTLEIEASIGVAHRTYTTTTTGWVDFERIIGPLSADIIEVQPQMSAAQTATIENIQLTIEPFGKLDW